MRSIAILQTKLIIKSSKSPTTKKTNQVRLTQSIWISKRLIPIVIMIQLDLALKKILSKKKLLFKSPE